jgi:hypothetical protein
MWLNQTIRLRGTPLAAYVGGGLDQARGFQPLPSIAGSASNIGEPLGPKGQKDRDNFPCRY